MIYRNLSIPDNFNRIAEFGDNYIVWVRENKLNNGVDYNAYIQFFTPSFAYIYTETYRIQNGTEYTFIPQYTNNGGFSVLSHYDKEFSLNTMYVDYDYITSNEFNRSDLPQITVVQFLFVFGFIWIFSRLSKLFYKGGLN